MLATLVTLPLAVAFHLPTLWFLVPFAIISFTHRSYDDYGLSWGDSANPRLHLGLILFVFVPYVLGHYLFGRMILGQSFHLRLPEQFAWMPINQFLGIALPEEFFFRGYVQTQCDQAWGKPWRLFGVGVGWGLPVAALIFAACHIINGGAALLIVFFPGLLYGWLRARTDSIVLPAAYHALSNLLMSIMLESLSGV